MMTLMLTATAQAFQGRKITLDRDGIAVSHMDEGDLAIYRRTHAGETGTVVRITDAGFNGLMFSVKLDADHPAGEFFSCYECDIVERRSHVRASRVAG